MMTSLSDPKISFSIDHAITSVYAVHCDSGKVLIADNCDLSMIPASCLKVITTGAALHLLGPNSRFATQLEYDGWFDRQILYGNIYIKGGGDPCLGSDRVPGSLSWEEQIALWADAIQKLGIQHIKGKIIGDASRWEKALAVPSWAWEDLGNHFGVGASALTFHENSCSIFFNPPHAIGEPVSIMRINPPLTSHIFQNETITGFAGSEEKICLYGSEFSSNQCIRGSIPIGSGECSVRGAVPDSASFCADLLTSELEKRNIVIENNAIETFEKRISFHVTYSPSIAEIVHWTNQKSINLYAEHLLKKMGEVVFLEGSTNAGLKAVTEFWQSQDINLGGFHICDGSGLSRKNLVTARQLVEILMKMKESAFSPIFYHSLPQKENDMRAKSGSLSLIKGFAGYTDQIAFAVLVNQCSNQSIMNEKVNAMLAYFNEISQRKS